MKITRIRIYKTPLPYVGGAYVWGAGNAIETALASVVVIDTDAGLQGCGEFTPCGENYMVAHSEGVEALARLVVPRLLGEDPRQVAHIEQIMDHAVLGHGYAKAPFDAACWDILGQACGQPVWMLMGGKLTDGAPMYRVAPQKATTQTIAEMEDYRAQGYRQFQIKVGGDWATDIDRIRDTVPLLKPGEKAMADANQGWRVDNAIRVAEATRDLDYILEQPCRTYEECQQVRPHVAQPMKLDECVTGIHMAQRIVRDRSAEICCLKIFQPWRHQQGAPRPGLSRREPHPGGLRGHLGRGNHHLRCCPFRRLDTTGVPAEHHRPDELQHAVHRHWRTNRQGRQTVRHRHARTGR